LLVCCFPLFVFVCLFVCLFVFILCLDCIFPLIIVPIRALCIRLLDVFFWKQHKVIGYVYITPIKMAEHIPVLGVYLSKYAWQVKAHAQVFF
jgi:hypothetical protein